MRPVRRGSSPQGTDFGDFHKARPDLVSRLGLYCSYCERHIVTALAVEHIQPKSKFDHLEGRWENFLLACVNCNATKLDHDIALESSLWPDRDNTFVALTYREDGAIEAATSVPPIVSAMAASALALIGLDNAAIKATNGNRKAVALDRISQRIQAWGKATIARDDVVQQASNEALKRQTIALAKENGHFSVWMAVFSGHAEMRNRLIDAFPGTRESGCFCGSGEPISPAPNPDGLPHGGKA